MENQSTLFTICKTIEVMMLRMVLRVDSGEELVWVFVELLRPKYCLE